MNCKNCNAELEKKWNFCPKCGFQIIRESFFDKILSRAVSRIGPFREVNKVFEEMEKKNLNRSNSFSVSISFQGDNEPQVRIQPLGQAATNNKNASKKQEEMPLRFSRKVSGSVKEPKTEIKKINNRFIANVFLPDIDSEKDVEIGKFGESIEIRAYAKDKTYFKILKCSENSEITKKNFENGKLLLEFL